MAEGGRRKTEDGRRLEGDVVFGEFGGFGGGGGGGGCGWGCCCWALAGGEELEGFGDDADFGAFLAAGFVVPGVEVESSFDVERGAFGAEFGDGFGGFSPEGDV